MLASLSIPQQTRLNELPKLFSELGYTELDLRLLLDISDVWDFKPHEVSSYIWRCRRERSVRGILTALFLLEQPVQRAGMERFIEPVLVDQLLQVGALIEQEGTLTSPLNLYPSLGRLIFTDRRMARDQEEGHVYELGADSYYLLRSVPRAPVKRTLDLCTGSGVQAIISSHHSQEVVACDTNPRALDFADLNARINGCTNIEWVASNLYQGVPKGPYDLILANPPFVPSPDPKILAHRSVDESGEEVVAQIIAGLPEYLAPGGLLAMVLDFPLIQNQVYLDRLEDWLGQTYGFGIALVHYATQDVSSYIEQHIDYHHGWDQAQNHFHEYFKSYEKQSIVGMASALVFIRRLSKVGPNWKELKRATLSTEPLGGRVLRWLRGLELAYDSSWRPAPDWVPCWNDLYEGPWRNTLGHGRLLTRAPEWVGNLGMTAVQADLALHIDGRTPAGDLLANWPGGSDEATAILRQLVRFEALTL